MATLLLGALPATPLSLNLRSHLSSSQSQTLGLSLSLPFATTATATSPSHPLVYCGRGDRKTAKGKKFAHSFGNARPRNKKKGRGPPRITVPAAPLETDKIEEEEVVKIEIDESLFSG